MELEHRPFRAIVGETSATQTEYPNGRSRNLDTTVFTWIPRKPRVDSIGIHDRGNRTCNYSPGWILVVLSSKHPIDISIPTISFYLSTFPRLVEEKFFSPIVKAVASVVKTVNPSPPPRGLLSSLPKTRTFIFNAERLHETRIDTNSLGISSNFSALEERIGKKKQGGGKKCFAETGFSLDPLFFIRAAHFFTRLARNGFRHDKNSRASNCCPSLSPVQFLQTHACFALFPEISLDYSIKLRSARSKNSSG